VSQRDNAWLDSATPAEINAARRAGELNEVLGLPAPFEREDEGKPVSAEELEAMTPAQVMAAYRAGKLNAVLAKPTVWLAG